MARRRGLLQLQLLALASASALLLASSLHTTPAFPVDLSASLVHATDASAAAPPPTAGRTTAAVPVSRLPGPRHRLLADVPAYAEADDPVPSSSVDDDAPAASSSSDDTAADNSPLKTLRRALGPFFLVAAVLFILAALGVFFLALTVAYLAAASVANRCATAWRKRAARVRPVDEDAAVAAAGP